MVTPCKFLSYLSFQASGLAYRIGKISALFGRRPSQLVVREALEWENPHQYTHGTGPQDQQYGITKQ